jgi:serine/threonine-protein kinase
MPLREPSESSTGIAGQLAVALEQTLDSANAGPQSAADVQVTQRLGRFVLLRQLGAGGMGSVFAAYDEQLDRKVALKLLHMSSSVHGDQRLRVLREAQAMARVSHPNVVHVYDVGEVGGRIFIAMEFVDGDTLTSWQQAQPRSWQLTLSLYRQAADGLLAAHQNGLVHRDFKPDNVLVGQDGRARVADFGLARLHGEDVASSGAAVGSQARAGIKGAPLTAAGAISGTPGFMSPEQYRGDVVDSRSDQFSFCVALYQALFKRLPFAGETIAEQAANVLAGRLLLPPEDAPVPISIRSAVVRGLSVEPADRFPTMTELLAALSAEAVLDAAAGKDARRRLLTVLFTGVMLLAAATAVKFATGGITVRMMVIIAAAVLSTMIAGAIGFRRSLLIHPFQRGLIGLMLVATSAWFGVRCLGLALQVELTKMIPIDLMVFGGLYATIAYQFLPGVWLLAGAAGVGAIVSVIRPQNAEQIYLAFYTVVSFIMVWAWDRAATHRKAHKLTGNQLSTPTSS